MRSKVRSLLVQQYEASRRQGLPASARRFPALAQRYFSNIGGYEPAEFIRMMVGDAPRRVLVVGVGGGRDHFWLEAQGHQVVSIDLAYQDGIPMFARADMAMLPFRDGGFEVVVVADALEHTFEDYQAAREFRRVLDVGGSLVLNVPFGDDAGEHHVRVYTEPTLVRLLSSAGFSIEKMVYRGLMPLIEQNVPGARHAFHGLNLLVYLTTRRSVSGALLDRMVRFDWRRGERSAGLRRFSRVHGAYVLGRANAEFRDFRKVNFDTYNQQATSMSSSFLSRGGDAP